MKINMNSRIQRIGEFVGKDEEKNVFLLKNTKDEIIEVSPMVFQLWNLIDDKKTVREIIDEYLKFYHLKGWELRRIVKEILEMFVEKSLLSIQA